MQPVSIVLWKGLVWFTDCFESLGKLNQVCQHLITEISIIYSLLPTRLGDVKLKLCLQLSEIEADAD